MPWNITPIFWASGCGPSLARQTSPVGSARTPRVRLFARGIHVDIPPEGQVALRSFASRPRWGDRLDAVKGRGACGQHGHLAVLMATDVSGNSAERLVDKVCICGHLRLPEPPCKAVDPLTSGHNRMRPWAPHNPGC